ncbi:MAG: hypothetical protein QOF76_1128 [Solirubrobacteraceae bacterium]|jgi:hypothetical protein|nr:hypothetical protein [Solirubrobacteraceae bacterium]
MAGSLIKSVVLNNFNAGSDASNNLFYWASDIAATNTDWIRIWIDWTVLAPNAPEDGRAINPALDTKAPDDGSWSPAAYVYYLDFQVRAARKAGFKVIITFWLYPKWANGGGQVYELAEDCSLTGPWAQYLLWILTRYSVYNPDNEGGYADIVEICNETDYAPSAAGDRSDTAAKTAQMMVTAKQLRDTNHLQAPILAGPAHTDDPGSDGWVDMLIADLQGMGFHGDASFAWTLHNYTDVALGTVSRAQTTRAKLAPFWAGWPHGVAGDDSTFVLSTEGGSLAADRTLQRDLVANAFARYRADDTGKGLLMFSQYLNVSSPVFDSGMRDYSVNQPQGASLDRGAPRRPLWATWSRL